MTEQERYLFDVQGYLVVEDALDRDQLAALNEILDRKLNEEVDPDKNTQRFGGLLRWGKPYLGLLDNPRIMPYLSALLGDPFRLDHDYCDVIRSGKGPIGTNLHGGGASNDLTAWYRFHNGNLRSGLTVVAYNLKHVRPGDGGFGCVPGSHKANLPLPAEWRDTETEHPLVTRVTSPAGTAILFTEALTHGTLPWRGKSERRTVFYKYSPYPLAYASPRYKPGEFPDLTERQRDLLEPPRSRRAAYQPR
jgi:ectoine hydroxylase-related dioxygenase (phytanoyl-CoA dioxygenase family)